MTPEERMEITDFLHAASALLLAFAVGLIVGVGLFS